MPSEEETSIISKRSGFRLPEHLLLPWGSRQTISSSHAAKLLGVCKTTVCEMVEDGTLKAYKVRPDKPNSPWRINYDSVIAHLERIHEENALEKRFYSDAPDAASRKSANSVVTSAPASLDTKR